MASGEVVTYKRKRLFSRKDHAHVDFNFDKASKVSELKDLDKCNKRGESIVENVLPNKDKEVKNCDEHSKANNEENVLQCGLCNSQCNGLCSEKHQSMFEMLCAACTKQQDSLASNSSGNCMTPDEKPFPTNSDVQDITLNANKVPEGSHREKSLTDSAGNAKAEEQSADVQAEYLSVKLGLENEGKCKELVSMPPLPPPAAQSCMESDLIYSKISDGIGLSHPMDTSILGTYTLEEMDKLNKDQCRDLRNDLAQRRKLTSALITYKRNKRSRNIAMSDIGSGYAATTCASNMPPATDCSVDLKDEKAGLSKSFTRNEEKKYLEDTSVLTPATEVVVQIEDSLHMPIGASTDALVQVSRDSRDMSSLKGKARIDDESKDMNPRRIAGSASGKRDFLTMLDLSLSSHASHDIDCNRALDENFLTGPSEVHPDSAGLKGKENTCKENSSLARAVTDKGKLIVDQPPALTGTSSKNNYLQLFPENGNPQALHLANHLDMASQLRPSSSLFHGISLQPEVMANVHHAAFPAVPEWPYLPAHHGQALHDFLLPTSDRAHSFPRNQMLLDNILTRARVARGGNQSSHLDKFVLQTTWSEEELDCLWIGVRRHGRGNWDVILGDRRLQFSPWKTARDLAEKWQEEQSQLFSGTPMPQARYTCPPDVQLSLGYAPLTPYDPSAPKRSSVHFVNSQPNRSPQELYASAGTLAASYGFHPGTIPASFPNWLSDTSAGVPPRPSDPTHTVRHPGVVWLNQQPSYAHTGMYIHQGLYNPSAAAQRRAEPQTGGRPAPAVVRCGRKRKANKPDNPIVIPSDGSSEETISDDRSMNP